jgi:hypothetical protein
VLRRFAYALIVIVWLVLMALPFLAFILAVRGELMIGDDQTSNIRIFMLTEDEAKGIGFQRVKKANVQDESCYQTSITYLLWEGQDSDLNVSYCTCLEPETGYTSAYGKCQDR